MRTFDTIPLNPIRSAGALAALVALTGPAAAQSPFPTQTFDEPSPTFLDMFGRALAVDAGRVLIGAPDDNTEGVNVGQAHLFDAETGQLLQTFNDPTVIGDDNFGDSVSLQGDLVLIGAPGDSSQGQDVGQAHLFDANSGEALHTFDNPAPAPSGSIDGGDRFGDAVAVDGDHILIGAPGDDFSGDYVGRAYLFDINTGDLLHTFDDPTPTSDGSQGDQFGAAVDLEADRALIGAKRHGVLGNNIGQAHLFDIDSGDLLRTFDDPTPTNSDIFGDDVALDAGRALIGAPGDDTVNFNTGQAHLFDVDSGDLLHTFNDPTPSFDPALGDLFGDAVAIDGDNVLIGDPLDDNINPEIGQAHLFSAGTGDLMHTLDDPTPTINPTFSDHFGRAVAIDGPNAVVGAPMDNSGNTLSGQANLFAVSVCPADLNGDDVVDGADLGVLLGDWGDASSGALADFNGDGVVDGADLGLLLGQWGDCG